MTGTKVGQNPYIKIDDEVYHLATKAGVPVFSSGTRALEGVPSDAFEIVWDDWAGGLGVDYFACLNLLTTIPGRIKLRPEVPFLSPSGPDKPYRYSFEEQDSNGRWYKYFITQEHLVKVDIGVDPPVVRQVYDVGAASATSWDAMRSATDKMGQPWRGVSSSTVYWYIPANNADRIIRMTTPVEVDTGAGTGDTFSAVTAVTDGSAHSGGAAHFLQMPSGKVWRAVSSHSAGTFQNRAAISVLQAGADPEVDANWGEDFEVDNQTLWIVGMLNYGEYIIAGKQNGWFGALENQDTSLRWENLIADPNITKIAALGSEDSHAGGAWHGRMYLPLGSSLNRSIVFSSKPVGPDSRRETMGEPVMSAFDLHDGTIPSVEPAGEWLYFPYNDTFSGGFNIGWVLAAREPAGASPYELELHPIYYDTEPLSLTTVQRNGEGAPRLWICDADATRIQYIQLGGDLGPFAIGQNQGDTSTTGSIVMKPVNFPCRVLLRELRLQIEAANAEVAWAAAGYIDGVSSTKPPGSLTATGSLFWVADEDDTCRRFQLLLQATMSGSYTPADAESELMRAVLNGYYLPDVGETLSFVVDVERTAEKTNKAQETVVANLKALRNAGSKSYTDTYGTGSQFVLVKTTSENAAKRVAGIEGENLIGVTAELMEYS